MIDTARQQRLIAILAVSILVSFVMIGISGHRLFAAEPARSVIVVRPKAWSNSILEWAEYRKPNYKVIELDSMDSPYDLRQRILHSARNAKQPVSAVLLCGDVAQFQTTQLGNMVVERITPTFEIPTRVKLGPFTTPTLATDTFYGDLDDDECPDIAVGRLPAKNAIDLQRMLKRSIVYEQSKSFGPWRDRVHATAGVGGFGVVADTAIETVTRRFLADGIPDRFQLQMTYASLTSPYCPPPPKFASMFIDKLNQGGMFWVYIGHGNVNRLDDFVVGNREYPICTAENIPQIRIPDGQPIAVLLACLTGAYDAKVDCFAEMLLAKDDGPIAVIAGSRVTMPYGMSQFAGEIMDGCFVDHSETLGEIVLNAKRSIWQQEDLPSEERSSEKNKGAKVNEKSNMKRLRERQNELIEGMAAALSPEGHVLQEERREHVRLMNLLGDPLLRVRYPKEISLQCAEQVQVGQKINVDGVAPFAGTLRSELVLSRDRLPAGLQPIGRYSDAAAIQDQMQKNYDIASDLIVLRSEKRIEAGKFAFEMEIPIESRGRCVVRVYVYGEDDWASGTSRLKVLKPSAD